MRFNIMIVEDDEILRRELEKVLIKNQYQVTVTQDFEHVPELVKKTNPHLILLDINLPVKDGFYICTEIREFSSVPIIFLTARNSDIDELMGLSMGGDDYIVKPYNTFVFLARIQKVLSRSYAFYNESRLQHREVYLDLGAGVVEYRGKVQNLSKNELKILNKLFTNPGKIVSRYEMMEYLWDNELFIEDNTLSVNIARIRQKLSEIGLDDFISTKKGQGYMI